ncbi:MAG: 50S ribosomal protein L30 [Armatimonadota bacterium]
MKVQVKLIRSPIGSKPRNRKTIEALGLRKVNQVVVHEDSPSLRGMLHNVRHMVEVQAIHE